MTKNEMKLLERAYAAEIDAALSGGPHVMQTRSKLAAKLVTDGLLQEATCTIKAWPFPTSVVGYELTQAGRMAYCASCA